MSEHKSEHNALDPESDDEEERPMTFREKTYEVIFEADTTAGKVFDVLLLVVICTSLLIVALETVSEIQESYGGLLRVLEWIYTGLFTVELALRLYCSVRPLSYLRSFYGIVDVLAVLPSYLSLLFPGAQALLVVRAFRLLRVFRIFKLARYLGEAQLLRRALAGSRIKITVFLITVMNLVVLVGAAMYLIEQDTPGFESIPSSMYWAIVTMTTVGYGDIVPMTVLGKILASGLMVMGYGILAVPTGIVSAEIVHQGNKAFLASNITSTVCRECHEEGHESDAEYCKYCSAKLL